MAACKKTAQQNGKWGTHTKKYRDTELNRSTIMKYKKLCITQWMQNHLQCIASSSEWLLERIKKYINLSIFFQQRDSQLCGEIQISKKKMLTLGGLVKRIRYIMEIMNFVSRRRGAKHPYMSLVDSNLGETLDDKNWNGGGEQVGKVMYIDIWLNSNRI